MVEKAVVATRRDVKELVKAIRKGDTFTKFKELVERVDHSCNIIDKSKVSAAKYERVVNSVVNALQNTVYKFDNKIWIRRSGEEYADKYTYHAPNRFWRGALIAFDAVTLGHGGGLLTFLGSVQTEHSVNANNVGLTVVGIGILIGGVRLVTRTIKNWREETNKIRSELTAKIEDAIEMFQRKLDFSAP